jgi:hypothetical protein
VVNEIESDLRVNSPGVEEGRDLPDDVVDLMEERCCVEKPHDPWETHVLESNTGFSLPFNLAINREAVDTIRENPDVMPPGGLQCDFPADGGLRPEPWSAGESGEEDLQRHGGDEKPRIVLQTFPIPSVSHVGRNDSASPAGSRRVRTNDGKGDGSIK